MKSRKNPVQHFKEEGGFEIDLSMKHEAVDDPFTEIPPSERMTVFLRQHIGKETIPLVEAGESVEFGQKIGDLQDESVLGAAVHSPVEGTVEEVVKREHPLSGNPERAAVIRTESDRTEPFYEPLDPDRASREELLTRIKEAGVVGLGGAGFPTHAKLSEHRDVSHLIVNAKESDPNLACDVRLMMEKGREVLRGIKIMSKILDVQHVLFATRTREGEVPDFEELLTESGIQIARIRSNYSVGAEGLLVKEVLDQEVPSGEFPPSVGAVVHNVSTAHATAQAMEGRPVVSRGLTLYSGETGGKNLWVRSGTPVSDPLRHCGASPTNFRRVVIGSIMMGPTVPDPTFPVMKVTSGITAFTNSEPSPYRNEKPCIRCGYCNTVCPVDIYPEMIMRAQKRDQIQRLEKLYVKECIDCGLCSYVCPSDIKLTPHLRAAMGKVS